MMRCTAMASAARAVRALMASPRESSGALWRRRSLRERAQEPCRRLHQAPTAQPPDLTHRRNRSQTAAKNFAAFRARVQRMVSLNARLREQFARRFHARGEKARLCEPGNAQLRLPAAPDRKRPRAYALRWDASR